MCVWISRSLSNSALAVVFRFFKNLLRDLWATGMAEKFANQFGPGAHQLKIGKSFEKKGGNSVYHSIRYDFKPVSVDEERKGTLEVSMMWSDQIKKISFTGPRKQVCVGDSTTYWWTRSYQLQGERQACQHEGLHLDYWPWDGGAHTWKNIKSGLAIII